MLYDVGISGTRSLRPELFGLSDSCGAHSSYTVLDDQSPINPKNLKNKNTFKMAATLLAQPATYFIKTWVDTCEVKTFSIWRMLQLPDHERDEALINRTNNGLERFNRLLNKEFPYSHP
jgi:hypothetical protein